MTIQIYQFVVINHGYLRSQNYVTSSSLEKCFELHKSTYYRYKSEFVKIPIMYQLFDLYGPNNCQLKLIMQYQTQNYDDTNNSMKLCGGVVEVVSFRGSYAEEQSDEWFL